MPSIDDRLRTHAEQLDLMAPYPPRNGSYPSRPMWPLAVAIGATAAAVALLAVGVAFWGRDDTAVVATASPATTTPGASATLPSTVGTLPDPVLGPDGRPQVPPTEPPEGWVEVEHGGLRMFAPPTWSVQSEACPGDAKSISVGSAPSDCTDPPRDRAWIWLAPAESLDEATTGCSQAWHNGLPGCLTQEFVPTEESMVNTLLVDGTSVAIVWVEGRASSQTGLSDIVRTWQYSDLSRPEAERADPLGSPAGYQQEQPLAVAGSFALAIAQGRCEDAAELMAASEVPCDTTTANPSAELRESALQGVGGAVKTQGARIVVEPGPRVFQLTLQTEWSLEDQVAHWRIVEVSES